MSLATTCPRTSSCDFTRLIGDETNREKTRILPSNSTSPTIQLINGNYFFKVGLCEKFADDVINCLQFEISVYNLICQKMLDAFVSPHFVGAAQAFRCEPEEFEKALIPNKVKNVWSLRLLALEYKEPSTGKKATILERILKDGKPENLESNENWITQNLTPREVSIRTFVVTHPFSKKKMKKKKSDTTGQMQIRAVESGKPKRDVFVNQCVTGVVLNRTDAKMLSQLKITTESDLRALLFQVIYTLAAMEEVGLAHNDLHANNLFVEVLPRPQTRLYIPFPLSEKHRGAFLVTTRLHVRFFDWDRAVVDCGKANKAFHNKLLKIDYEKFRRMTGCENRFLDEDFCDFGQCNKPGAYRADLWKFLHSLKHGMKNPLSPPLLETLRELELRHCSKTIAALDSGQLARHGGYYALALPLNVVVHNPLVEFERHYYVDKRFPQTDLVPKIRYNQMLGVSTEQMLKLRGTLTDKLAFPEEKVDGNSIRAWMHPAKEWLLDEFFSSPYKPNEPGGAFGVSVDHVQACREMMFSLPNTKIHGSNNFFAACSHPLARTHSNA